MKLSLVASMMLALATGCAAAPAEDTAESEDAQTSDALCGDGTEGNTVWSNLKIASNGGFGDFEDNSAVIGNVAKAKIARGGLLVRANGYARFTVTVDRAVVAKMADKGFNLNTVLRGTYKDAKGVSHPWEEFGTDTNKKQQPVLVQKDARSVVITQDVKAEGVDIAITEAEINLDQWGESGKMVEVPIAGMGLGKAKLNFSAKAVGGKCPVK